MFESYEDLILARQEAAEEDFDVEAEEHENRRLEEVYPFLFR